GAGPQRGKRGVAQSVRGKNGDSLPAAGGFSTARRGGRKIRRVPGGKRDYRTRDFDSGSLREGCVVQELWYSHAAGYEGSCGRAGERELVRSAPMLVRAAAAGGGLFFLGR